MLPLVEYPNFCTTIYLLYGLSRADGGMILSFQITRVVLSQGYLHFLFDYTMPQTALRRGNTITESDGSEAGEFEEVRKHNELSSAQIEIKK